MNTNTTIWYLAKILNIGVIAGSYALILYCSKLLQTDEIFIGQALLVLNLILFKAFYQSEDEIKANIAEFNSKQEA